jgi:DNA-binding CsgD family transcriptional regulator
MPHTPLLNLSPQKLGAPAWKKYWEDREFAKEIIERGIVEKQLPETINRIFYTGPYFILVADYRDMSLHYMKGVEGMLGIAPEKVKNFDITTIVALVHPDDVEKLFGLGVHYFNFLDQQPMERRLDFKASINFRLKKTDGKYIKVIEQIVSLNMDENGKITYAIKYVTDISHLDYSTEVVLAIFDDKAQGDQKFYTFSIVEKKVPQTNEDVNATFSNREKEVLSSVALGKTSKEIAAALGISTFTVNKHRENMMRKTRCKNMNEVVSFAYCNDYLQ